MTSHAEISAKQACDVYLFGCMLSVAATIAICSRVQKLYKEDIDWENQQRDEPVERNDTRKPVSIAKIFPSI